MWRGYVKNLRGKIVGLLVEEGFEQVEFEKTEESLEEVGAIVEVAFLQPKN
jgi:hypothetical protein